MRMYKFIPAAISILFLCGNAAFASHANDPVPGEGVVEPLPTLQAERLKTSLDRPDLIAPGYPLNAGYLSLAEMLIGRIPGVQVTGNYFHYRIRIRGSLHPPLVVVDKMPFYDYDDDMINTLLRDIPAAEVASIKVIKNLAQAALFGAGARNGVILITTRSGQPETE